MQPSRLFRIDDLLEEPTTTGEIATPDSIPPLRVPTAADLSRQILRLAAMATIEHQRVAHELDAASASNVRPQLTHGIAPKPAKRAA